MNSLKSFPLFEGVDDNLVDAFEKRCHWSTYAAGEMIIDHLEPSKDVRFIASGSVRIVVRMTEGREVIFNDFSEGRFFGELAAIDGGVRSANVSAQTNVTICIMPQKVFEEFCTQVPKVGWRVMNHLVKLVRHLSDRLSEFTFLKAKHRLYAELLRLSRERRALVTAGDDDAGATEGQRIISPMPRQSDIADRISSRREIVSRDMKDLERQGILQKTRGGLVILKPDLLGRMAAEGWLSGE